MTQTAAKVIWTEGVMLGQQHFQQWERYLLEQMVERWQLIKPAMWGLINLEIDEAALVHGNFRLLRCKALMRHGQLIDFTAERDGELGYQLTPQSGPTEIYLAVAMNGQVVGINGYPEPSSIATWRADYRSVSDCYDNRREREVMVGELNLQLLSAKEVSSHYHYLKIAAVRVINNHSWQPVKAYIPPLVHISASSYLRQLVKQFDATLELKLTCFVNSKSDAVSSRNQIISQILVDAQLALQNIIANSAVHPEQLYLVMTQLINRLAILCRDYSLHKLPAYQHEDLSNCFSQLEQLLSELFALLLPQTTAKISLERSAPATFISEKIAPELLQKYDLFIEIDERGDSRLRGNDGGGHWYDERGDSRLRGNDGGEHWNDERADSCLTPSPMGSGTIWRKNDDESCENSVADNWPQQFVRQVKVGPYSVIEQLTVAAVSGIELKYVAQPPTAIVRGVNYRYFHLQTGNSYWQLLLQEQILAIKLPLAWQHYEPNIVLLAKNGVEHG